MNISFNNLLVALILSKIESASTNDLLNPLMITPSQVILDADKRKRFSEDEFQVLRVSTAQFEPYIYQDDDGNFNKGIEYGLVRRIARRLNKTLHFQTTSNHSDICNNVVHNISDICIGGIFPKEIVLRHTDMSVTYASDDLTWCVQKAKIMPKFLSQMLLLQPETWLLIFFGYGYVGGTILYLLIQFDLKYKRRNNCDWHYIIMLVALQACLGLSPGFKPTSGLVRSFYTLMLFSAFFFFQIVFVSIHEYLHRSIPWHQISTFKEIIENDFRLLGSQEAFEIPNHKIEFFHICEHINECMEQLIQDDKIAVGGSRQNILNSKSYSPSLVYCFDRLENIASYPIALYMRKDFYWKKEIDYLIRQLVKAGFFEKWNKDCRLPKWEVPSVVPLQLSHILAITIFDLCIGSLMAIFTLVCEKYIFWKIKQQNKRNIWNYLEQLFDGQRHYFKNVPERLAEQNKHNIYEVNFPYLE